MKRIYQLAIAAFGLASLSCSSTEPTATTTAVGAIVINPQAPTLALNASLPLQVQVQDASGAVIAGAPVTWSVRDPGIASVSETGLVTALALGTTEVAASSRGVSAIATVTVQRTQVASVVVTPDRVDAVVGSNTPLTAIALDAEQNTLAGRGMVWTTSNAGVATVDGTGVVTGVGPGSATITATSEGKSDASSVTISVGAIASVAVTPNPVTLVAGQNTQLAATARDGAGTIITGKTVIWSSSNTSVANVSSDGIVTGVGSGSTTITATVEGVAGTTAVTVSNVPVASVDVTPKGPTLATTASTQLTATTKDAAGKLLTGRVVTWATSSAAIASVSGTGVVTGVAPGTATITATSEGKTGSTTVTVTLVPVGSVVVAPATLTLTPGQTGNLAATVTDANGKVVTDRPVAWSSSDDLKATVSQSGVVTAIAPGTVTITAASGGKSATADVTVTLIPAAGVAVSPSSLALTPGETGTLAATVTDANGNVLTRAVTWTSSAPLTAAVDATTGVVRAGLIPGSATITATEPTGKSGTATATVTLIPATPPAVNAVTVTPSTATLSVGQGTTLSAAVTDANGTAIPGAAVTWSSSSASVADVSNGTVTAKAAGTATITAASGGKSGTATITVNAVSPSAPGPAATVTVTPAIASVRDNKSIQLTAKAVDANATAITGRAFTWTSSNSNTASVNSSGVVTGRRTGIVTITATLDGKSGSSLLTVTR